MKYTFTGLFFGMCIIFSISTHPDSPKQLYNKLDSLRNLIISASKKRNDSDKEISKDIIKIIQDNIEGKNFTYELANNDEVVRKKTVHRGYRKDTIHILECRSYLDIEREGLQGCSSDSNSIPKDIAIIITFNKSTETITTFINLDRSEYVDFDHITFDEKEDKGRYTEYRKFFSLDDCTHCTFTYAQILRNARFMGASKKQYITCTTYVNNVERK